MRLTSSRAWENPGAARLPAALAVLIVLMISAVVFVLDWATGLPHVQHLYYFPIVFAAVRFGMRGGAGAATLAIVLYHLANPQAISWQYEESDVLQMAVFVASGLVAARLADDARQLHRLAMTDDLTGLHNLRSFELQVRKLMQAARIGGLSICLLVLDVDRLKSLNDTYGHLTGAEAVRTVGRLIADEMPTGAVACRYGGDEFVIALPHSSIADGLRIADTLRQVVQACSPLLAGVQFPARTLSISIGLACRAFDHERKRDSVDTDDDAEAETLFRAADTALYAAKEGGRNTIQVANGNRRSGEKEIHRRPGDQELIL